MNTATLPRDFIVLTPVFNDWESLASLIQELDRCLGVSGDKFSVVAVDDGSTAECSLDAGQFRNLQAVKGIEVVHLTRNVGHQKAIAIGLAHIHASKTADAVVVMDSDGEDRPADAAALIEAWRESCDQIVFAKRARRSESLVFRAFYTLYRALFSLLTGTTIAFGNFSIIPAKLIMRVAYLPDIWNHYAAGLVRANLPYRAIPTSRGRRYQGRSSMNFVALTLHGLSAISVYIEVVVVRAIFAVLGFIFLLGLGFLAIFYIRFFTDLAIPGWATYLSLDLAVIASQAILFVTLLTFLVLHYRTSQLFIPAIDYRSYVWKVETVQ